MSDPREMLAEIQERADKSWRAWNPSDPRDHPSESVNGGIPARRLTFRSQEDVPRLVAALTAVLDVHVPTQVADDPTEGRWCNADADDYPCATVRQITQALEGGSS